MCSVSGLVCRREERNVPNVDGERGLMMFRKVGMALWAMSLACSVLAANEGGAFASAFQGEDDRVEFVRAMNASMRDYKAKTPERRLQAIYAMNRDAVRASPATEKKAVIAEVFATAPLDALPMIADRFAGELFNRKAAGLSDRDDSFTEFASATLMRVRNRVRMLPVDHRPGARSVFAVISFIKASEGKPADLRESLLFFILTGSQIIAEKEWIPAALGEDGKSPSYQPILSAGIEGEEPDHQNAHPMAPPELTVLQVGSDLRVIDAKDVSSPKPLDNMRGLETGATGTGVNRVPRADVQNPDSPWYRRRRGDQPDSEDEGYMGQGL